jgi:parallel beta-helix repeat protein
MKLTNNITVLIVLVLAGGLGTAQAQVSCGDTITSNMELTENLVCTDQPGTRVLTVTGPAKLDLNGFSVICDDGDDPDDDGIVLEGRSAKLQNGTVARCDDGVRLEGDGHHTVSGVITLQNDGDGFDVRSNHNHLVRSTGLLNESDGFEINGDFNVVAMSHGVANRNEGIDLDGGDGNQVANNTVLGNSTGDAGNGGLEVSDGSDDNHVISNFVAANDAHESDEAGIVLLGGDGNNVKGNTVRANRRNGILARDGSEDNSFQGNTATGNNIADSGDHDLSDDNDDCDNNKWKGNKYGTKDKACIN